MKTAIILLMLVAIGTLQAQTSSVQLQYPIGGEEITPGQNFDIHWQSDADSVMIKMVNIQTGVTTVVTEGVAGASGTYTWDAPSNLASGDMYLLKVAAKGGSGFSWTKAFLTVPSISSEMRATANPNENSNSNHTAIGLNTVAVASFPLSSAVVENKTNHAETTLAATDDDDFTNPNIICEQTVCKIKTFRIGRLYPQPSTNGIISIDAESNENATDVKAEIYSVTGQKLATVWEGNLKKGASTFMLTVSDIAVGSYILYLKNNKGEIVDYSRVVIAEGQR